MPEGDTIFRAARTLHRALSGQIVTGFQSVLPKLVRVNDDLGVVRRTVEKVEAQGKWIRMHLSGDLILLTHMLMSGSWHIYRPHEEWQRRPIDMRIVIKTERMWAVAFNVQIAEFHTPDTLRRREGFRKLGQDILGAQFDPAQAVESLRVNGDVEIGSALLMQSIVAGLGNVYKSEVCFACAVNPFRSVNTLSLQELNLLVDTARKFILANVSEMSDNHMITYTGMRHTTGRVNIEERLWVYGRRSKPCRQCGSEIESRKQGQDARVTFWCPQCQPMMAGKLRDAVAR